MPKFCDLLVEVGHMTNDWFAAVMNFLGPIFWGHELGHAQEALQMCLKALLPYI